MIQALIFDCFGVLVGKGFDFTYQTAGGDPERDRDFIHDLLGQANLGLISSAEFNQAIVDQLSITLDDWREAVRHAERPDSELLDYIQAMRASYKTAILSNANRGAMQHYLGQDTLDRCFDRVIVSAEVGLAKPDPLIYEHAAKQLQVEPEACVFVDDRQTFLDAAEKLGIKTILYQTRTQFINDLEQLLR